MIIAFEFGGPCQKKPLIRKEGPLWRIIWLWFGLSIIRRLDISSLMSSMIAATKAIIEEGDTEGIEWWRYGRKS